MVEAQGGPIRAHTPQTPEEAAYLSLSPLANTNTIQLQLSYTTIPDGGHAGMAVVRTGLWMPYVLIPGIEVPGMGGLVVMMVPYQTLDLPALPEEVNGLGDINLIDLAVYELSWGGIGLGPGFFFPAATSPILGQGKLQLGPVFSVGYSGVHGMLITLGGFDAVSVAGSPERPDVHTLYVAPSVGLMLPKAFYLYSDGILRFDWKRDGHATIPLNLGLGHAFTSHFVVYVQPEWVATGDLEDSFTARVVVSNLGW